MPSLQFNAVNSLNRSVKRAKIATMKGLDRHALWAKICAVLALAHLSSFAYGLSTGSRVASIWGLAGSLTWSAVTVAFWIKARQEDASPPGP
jgi:hypothetical protein